MRGKWLLFSVGAILLAIAAGAISVMRKTSEPVRKAEPKPEPPPIGDEVSLLGKIQAAHLIPVPAPVDGVLELWAVEVGDEVLEGQELGHIKNDALEHAQQQAQEELERAETRASNIEAMILAARLEAARAESEASRSGSEASRLQKLYEREQFLYREGATARLKFEKAEKDYKIAREEADTATAVAKQAAERTAKLEQDLELAKKTLEDRQGVLEEAKQNSNASNVAAPADGVIVKLGADPGAEVDRGMRDLVQIAVDPALLEMVVEPEPRVLEKMRPGLPALVLVPEITDEGLPGEVKEVKENQVIIEFTSPNPAIRHGMTGSVRVKLT